MTETPPSGGPARAGGAGLLPGRCPRCGARTLFAGPFTLSLSPACRRCGLDLRFADAGDGPAVFAILILGFLVLGAALIAEFKLGVSPATHVALWGVITPISALVLLRWLKSALIASQFKHQAGEGRIDPGAP